MAHQTLGQLLVNAILPKNHQVTEQFGKSSLNKKLTVLAREDPVAYVEIVGDLKKLGDKVSTLEGVSVGLDDLTPMYAERDKIMNPAMAAMHTAKSSAEREKIIIGAQDAILAHVKIHPGSMTQMAFSGARGNFPQLIKTVASPVAAVDAKGSITPWLFPKSYSEGLSAADYWVAGNEARINTVKSSTSVAEPGDLLKMVSNTLYPYTITETDCGTHNGIRMSTGDAHVAGRRLAVGVEGHKADTMVTPAILADLRKHHEYVIAKSPMTCAADVGVCRNCQGQDEHGRDHEIGIHVGLRASQALGEPLTQFALNAKHGVRLLKGAAVKLEGIGGFRQIIEVPQSFLNKATLAEEGGVVGKIVEAPHGGHYIHVGKEEHYVGPNLAVVVHEGQKVDAGDVLSDGIPKPDEIVRHKGLGAGREYLVDILHDLYKRQGVDVDKRHLELLARADLSHVRVLEASPDHPDVLRGDIIHYNKLKELAEAHTKEVDVAQAVGGVLGKEALHFTIGTPISDSMAKTLAQSNVTKVHVATGLPRVEFLMKPLARTPLLYPDWMARLSHRYLKDSLLHGAHNGDVSDLSSTHPVPAFAAGNHFGEGEDGRY